MNDDWHKSPEAAPFHAACLQITSDRDPAKTFPAVAALAREAAAAGASFIMTPEVTPMLEPRGRLVLEKARPEEEDEWLPRYRELAKETGAWFLLGSMAVRVADDLCANRSLLIDTQGMIVARYDKIHMFDVDLEGGESYRESRRYRPGGEAVLAATPWGTLGMTICYDMRFPALYRHLAQAGAHYLTVPSAFARPTGRAHWHVLLRARAIETGCFVFAPAQCGEHAEGRKTWGHSLIIDPWGEVLADGGEETGVVMAEIDPARIGKARGMVPSLGHDRPYAAADPLPESGAKTDAADAAD